MDRDFDAYLDRLSAPLEEPPPAPAPEPMENTVVVDLATEVENPKTYLDEGTERRLKQAAEGTVAPPVEIYEPGFRTDLYEALTDYFKKKREIRRNNDRIRQITGIGRYF